MTATDKKIILNPKQISMALRAASALGVEDAVANTISASPTLNPDMLRLYLGMTLRYGEATAKVWMLKTDLPFTCGVELRTAIQNPKIMNAAANYFETSCPLVGREIEAEMSKWLTDEMVPFYKVDNSPGEAYYKHMKNYMKRCDFIARLAGKTFSIDVKGYKTLDKTPHVWAIPIPVDEVVLAIGFAKHFGTEPYLAFKNFVIPFDPPNLHTATTYPQWLFVDPYEVIGGDIIDHTFQGSDGPVKAYRYEFNKQSMPVVWNLETLRNRLCAC